jgi:MoxR-like ATPase
MATATAPKLLDTFQRIFDPNDGFLAQYNVEREAEIELLGLSTITGVDLLFLGDPGVGKTWVIELMLRCITGAELFDVLLQKDMSADEVLGPRSLVALKDDRIERLITGFLPTANYAYLDEVFKASPTLLNPLLDIGANRVLKVAGKKISVKQLISIIYSSNELPDREDLMAFRDRIGVTKFVEPVRTPEGKRAVTDIQLAFQAGGSTIDLTGAPTLDLSDIEKIREEVAVIDVPDAIREIMGDAHSKWTEAGHPPSLRRVGQMWKMMKGRAWSKGRDHVVKDDIIVCQHMAWNHPDHAKSAHDIVVDYAGKGAQVAAAIKEEIEPMLTSLDSVLGNLKADDEEARDKAYEDGWKVVRDLRRQKKIAEEAIQTAKDQGDDTTDLNRVLSDINRAHDHAKTALDDA